MVEVRKTLSRSRRSLLGCAVAACALAAVPGVAAAQSSEQTAAVYGMTNGLFGNTVVAYPRAGNGTLGEPQRYATGGRGSGTIEDSSNGLVLADRNTEASPNNLPGTGRFLFATNAGSDSLTVFRVTRDGLQRVGVQKVGDHPTSVTVSNGIVYVMNSGGFMCSGSDLLALPPNVTGYRLSASGELTPIPGSRRFLSGGLLSGCNQVSFSPDGKVLIVTQQQFDKIDTFKVNDDGTLSGPRSQPTTGNGPFGFTFTRRGELVTTENFGAVPLLGGVASYEIGDDGTLSPIGSTERNGQSDTCWVVITDDDRFAYTASFGDNGSISSYRVQRNGQMSLIDQEAANLLTGASDLALSGDSRYLYALNSLLGTITAFRVGSDGALTKVDTAPTGGLLGVIGLSAN